MSDKLRWGILATGHIARKFAVGVRQTDCGEIVAVGSRTQAKADAFGQEFDIPHRHGSYEALAADADVDAVYVATPNPMHAENTLLCLKSRKAVLCEKPFAVNAAQAREMIGSARAAGLFLMEAMWTRFLPPIRKAKQLVDDGTIGELRMIMADFGFRGEWDPARRTLNADLAGGGLLDVGIYPISLSSMFFGQALAVAAEANIGETGVDEQAGMVVRYDGGRISIMAAGVRTQTPMEAWLLGTEGRIHLHNQWWRGSPLTLMVNGKEPETIAPPVEGNGFNYQIEEVARCIAAGKAESDIMPLDETLSIMTLMDDIRKQWGLKYPME
jgi:predicted dehydrogenase